MSDREERIISGLAEVKAEQAQTNLHLGQINGSIGKHFTDDAAWMKAHDEAEAKAEGFRKGLLAPLGVIIVIASIVGPTIVRLILGS